MKLLNLIFFSVVVSLSSMANEGDACVTGVDYIATCYATDNGYTAGYFRCMNGHLSKLISIHCDKYENSPVYGGVIRRPLEYQRYPLNKYLSLSLEQHSSYFTFIDRLTPKAGISGLPKYDFTKISDEMLFSFQKSKILKTLVLAR